MDVSINYLLLGSIYHLTLLQTHFKPTDFGQLVLHVLAKMTRDTGSIDQSLLRRCLGLTSSYLITDTCMNPERGLVSWYTGFNNLVDVLVALHARGELERSTLDEASKACSECWSVAGTWRGLEESKSLVRRVALKLRTVLDENGKTFGGEIIYAP